MDIPTAVSVIIGIMGLAGVIFTALKFNRDDTAAIVSQQDTLMNEMRGLNDELRITVDRLRHERDELQKTVDELKAATK
jgi:hypothetical protein